MTAIRLCIAGATGRTGSIVVKEALNRNFEIVGAVAAPTEKTVGKTLKEIGICNLDLKILSPENLGFALKNAEVYVSFTNAEAEVSNLPIVAEKRVKAVVGTTGFTEEQKKAIEKAVLGKIPIIFSPNFSIGINILFKIIQLCKLFPKEYDFSIIEVHHTGKSDAPSGTALKMADIISNVREYRERIYGRKGVSKRKQDELELLSARMGGVPGIHELIIGGEHELVRIEHTVFSRAVFAQGALYAAEWLYNKKEPRIYTMEDLLEEDKLETA